MKNIDKTITRIVFVWLIFGVLVSGIVVGLKQSRSLNFLDFYDTGKTYRIKTDDLDTMQLYGVSYDTKTKTFTINSSDAKITFAKAKKATQFYYMYLELEGMNRDTVIINTCFYNKLGNRIASQQDIFGNGGKISTIPVNGPFTSLKLMFQDQEGTSFRLEHLELKETTMIMSVRSFVIQMGCVFVFIQLLGAFIWFFVMKKRKEKLLNLIHRSGGWIKEKVALILECLQYVFLLEEIPAKWLSAHFNEKVRSRIRVGLIAFLCLYMNCMNKFGKYRSADYYKYHILLASFVIIVIAWLLYDGKLSYRKWNSNVACSWFFLCVSVCLGDMLMGSRYLATGYVWLFAFGSLYFFWDNYAGKKNCLLLELAKGIALYAILALLGLIIYGTFNGWASIAVHIPTSSELVIAWKTYLSDMNLIGHSTEANNVGRTVNVYNTLIVLMYRYGVFIIIPYLVLLYSMLEHLFVMSRRKANNDWKWMLGFEILYCVSVLCSNQEKPFLSPLWIAHYIVIGSLLKEETRGMD